MSVHVSCPHCGSTELDCTTPGMEAMLHCLRCDNRFRARDPLATAISARLRLMPDEEPATATEATAAASPADEAPEDVEQTPDHAAPPRVWEPPYEAAEAADLGDDKDVLESVPEIFPEGVAARGTTRRRRRRGGFLGQLFGIVSGGLLGLLLGYYVLVWLNGPQANFLGLSLPGLSSTDSPGNQTLKEAAQSFQTDMMQRLSATVEPETASPSEAHTKGPEWLRAGTKQFNLAELDQALAGLPNDANEKLDAEQYRKWGRLAEIFTYLRGAGTQADELTQQQAAIQRRMEQTLRSEEAVSDVGQLATAWLQRPRESDGALLAGTLQDVRSVDGYWISTVALAGTGETIATVGSEPPLVANGQPVMLMGVISYDPAGEFRGLTEEIPRAVWTGMLVPWE